MNLHSLICCLGEYIIGDSAYKKSCTVVVPFKKVRQGLTRKQILFNQHISSQRVYVEHTIGILKGRFQSLLGIRLIVDKQTGHRRVCEWIQACVVLHNILMKIDPWTRCDDLLYADPVEDAEEVDIEDGDGNAKRNALVEIVNAMYET